MIRSYAFSTIAILLLSGCEAGLGNGAAATRQGAIFSTTARPPNAAEGSCWARSESPAIIETVTREVIVQPAQVSSDGRIQQPAVYRRESRQEIVQERQDAWYELVCAAQLDVEFIASLQRAMIARGLLRGSTTGVLDNRTSNALRKVQKKNGFDSPLVSLAIARDFGLVVIPRTTSNPAANQ